MKTAKLQIIILLFLLNPLFQFCTQEYIEYTDFYNRLKAEESYIGFFAAEEKCIAEITDEYLVERKKYFLGISTCKEDISEFSEPFIEFLNKNKLLKEEYKDEWEKVLKILGFELYANIPIFNFTTDKVIEQRSIVYAEYPNKKLELDLFIPKTPIAKPIPAVVCIHGGGFEVNNRIWFEPFAKYLASKGIAAVTIDYRKLPAVSIMECINDSKAAVRWVRANAKSYGIDPYKIGALGASAGGHLVALLATSPNVEALEGNGGNKGVSSEVQAVVGFATPSVNLKKNKERVARYGLTEEQAKRISPYENISKNSAPLYLLHGTVDEIVEPENSQDLYDKYKEVGAQVKITWIPDKGHDFYEGNDMAIEKTAEYFIQQFTK